MSVIFSRQCEYALQGILYIASNRGKKYTDIKEISEKLKIPHHFLAKILQNLTKSGLLKSQKGPSGGFSLNHEPENITLYQIVEAIDGNEFLTKCVLGLATCGDENPCPLHGEWANLRNQIYDMLAGKTLDKIVFKVEGDSDSEKNPDA